MHKDKGGSALSYSKKALCLVSCTLLGTTDQPSKVQSGDKLPDSSSTP